MIHELGAPDAEYEGGRIIAYRLAEDDGGYHRPRPYDTVKYNLMLAFDGNAMLARHALVHVRELPGR